jgi:AhpD family alkylhydroperoxidase
MNERLKMKQIEPEAYSAMTSLEKYLTKTELTITHKNIVKIRASQINGCSYCIDMHVKEAIEAGENTQRLFLIGTWRETAFFTEEEKTVLSVAEEVTLIGNRLSNATYEKAVNIFGEKYVAQLIMAVIIINAWNRIGVATEMQPVMSS